MPTGGPVADWAAYGGDGGGSRYSPLTQIHRDNVQHLTVAWIYRTGDVSDGKKTLRKTSFQATPIMVDGALYLSTPFGRVIALDPETGRERWSFDPKVDLWVSYANDLISRGVSTYRLRETGRQFVVIAAGGHNRLGTKLGDHVVAFALPQQ